jgi:hypothetical protein
LVGTLLARAHLIASRSAGEAETILLQTPFKRERENVFLSQSTQERAYVQKPRKDMR